MESFDNAIHYGPNDAGASTLSIALVVLALLLGSWLFGAIYGWVDSYFSKNGKRNK